MSRLRRQVRQTLTIARRDFIATVFTPIFLLFLFAPVIMGSFGAIGGLGAANVADTAAGDVRLVVIADGADRALLTDADKRLRRVFRRDDAPPKLRFEAPAADTAAQAVALFAKPRNADVVAALHGPLAAPEILYVPQGARTADYLAEVADQALRLRATGTASLSTATKTKIARAVPSRGGRNQGAFLAVFGIFFLTLFLAGQVVGTMAEERNNKVIEVLAAAVPLESVFLGKLLGMFGVAVLFVGFWLTVASQLSALLPSAAFAELSPAIGFAPFVLLFAAYFTMAYLLLGSVFLGVGAQKVTPRGFNGFDPAAFAPGGSDPASSDGRIAASFDEMVAFNRLSAKTHSGIWRDLAIRKRPTEVDAQLGAVTTAGAEAGVATPTIDRLIALIHEIEAGRPLAHTNLEVLAAGVGSGSA